MVVPTQRWARWELRVCVHPHAGRQGVQQPPSCGKGLDGAAAGEARVAGPGPWVSGLRAQPGNGRWAWTGEGFWWVPSGLSPGPPLMSGHTLSLSFPACEAHSWVGSEGWRSWRMWVTGPKAAVHCAVTVPRVTPPGGSTRSRAGRGGGAAAQDPLRSSALPVLGAHSPLGDRTHKSQGRDYFWRRCPPKIRARGSVTASQARTVSWELGRHLKARAGGRLAGHWAVSRVGPAVSLGSLGLAQGSPWVQCRLQPALVLAIPPGLPALAPQRPCPPLPRGVGHQRLEVL